jgi:predicted phosphodiesterase
MQVYVREDIHAAPMRIVETKEKSIPVWLLPQNERTGRMTSKGGWKNLFFPKKAINWLTITETLQDIASPCRIAHDGKSFELRLSEQHLHFHPEIPLGVKKKHIQKNWLIFSPHSCSVKNIVGFTRLCDGQSIILGRESSLYANLFDLDKKVAKRHLQITNRHGDLILTPMEPGKTVSIVRLDDQDNRERIETHRYDALVSIREIYGGPIDILPSAEAQGLLEKTIDVIAGDRFAVKTPEGRSGGLIQLPDDLTPVIIGDLHAQVDNLLKILTENYLLECLHANTACVIILGDAVHSEIANEMEDMESSIVMMDLIFKLKCFLPNNIFYLRGNHDSFDPELSKNTIPQGILFKEKLKELRGTRYVQTMDKLYETLPYIVKNNNFYACHAAPPMSKTSLDKLINIHEHPDLIKDITTKRVQRQYNLNGYNKKDVKRFRKTLELPKGTPFIVGHTPLDPFGSYWKDVSNIKDHHIIYSGHQQGAQALLLDGNHVIPLGFSEEPVTKLIDKIL